MDGYLPPEIYDTCGAFVFFFQMPRIREFNRTELHTRPASSKIAKYLRNNKLSKTTFGGIKSWGRRFSPLCQQKLFEKADCDNAMNFAMWIWNTGEHTPKVSSENIICLSNESLSELSATVLRSEYNIHYSLASTLLFWVWKYAYPL